MHTPSPLVRTRRRVTVAAIGLAMAMVAVGCSNLEGQPTSSRSVVTVTTTASGSDADAHGFVVFGGGARCLGTDDAMVYMRTSKSALVVCQSETNRLYYRGYRISDGATIDLYEVERDAAGYVAVNSADNARYVIGSRGFQLTQNGSVIADESAVEVGPPMNTSIVLGSADAMGSTSRGYGSTQPDAITMGSCANAISRIVWHNWGAPESYGSGLGCVQVGEMPRYSLVASNVGPCHGVLAYRALAIAGDVARNICDD
ncbi:hypothetical protein HH308_09830 [Gordonia sp. TBRC 11910]|uniref:Uncharacterized protein n=1 Tax=Gordonia asplenii TaxID=2725283 RepID=A0A848KSU8_9ACTN|nr:hypothetical protein [Gordonia asplenii]NMO01510.1 hypothetical protein [Gordonia asplenii]